MTPEHHKITNRDLQQFGRDQQEKELSDRALFLRQRIRHIEDEMRQKLLILKELRTEFDKIQAERGLKNQTQLF